MGESPPAVGKTPMGKTPVGKTPVGKTPPLIPMLPSRSSTFLISITFNNKLTNYIRWMCGVTRKDKIRNEHVTKKITEKRLKWCGHVKRRDEGHVLRRLLDVPVETHTSTRKKTVTKTENQMERLV